jgi:hypothetical protein
MKPSPAWWDFVQAAIALLLLAFISSYSILSTENMIQGGNGVNVRPTLDVFGQPFNMAQGGYVGIAALAVLIAFLLWFLYLGYAFYFEHYRMHLESQQKGSGETFKTLTGLLIGVDSYANWNSLSRAPWPWYWQLTVTLGIAVALMYLGHYAFVHFMKGLNTFKQASSSKGGA